MECRRCYEHVSGCCVVFCVSGCEIMPHTCGWDWVSDLDGNSLTSDDFQNGMFDDFVNLELL